MTHCGSASSEQRSAWSSSRARRGRRARALSFAVMPSLARFAALPVGRPIANARAGQCAVGPVRDPEEVSRVGDLGQGANPLFDDCYE